MELDIAIDRQVKRDLEELNKNCYKLSYDLMNALRHAARQMREGVEAGMMGTNLDSRTGLLKSKVRGSVFKNRKKGEQSTIYLSAKQTNKGREMPVTANPPTWGVTAVGAFLEFGGKDESGVIRGQRGKGWLCIPAEGGPALTASGKRRYKTPWSFPGGLQFIKKRGEDKAFLVTVPRKTICGTKRKRRKDAKPFEQKIAYVLMKTVRIEPKHWMRKGVESRRFDLTGEILRTMDNTLRGVHAL